MDKELKSVVGEEVVETAVLETETIETETETETKTGEKVVETEETEVVNEEDSNEEEDIDFSDTEQEFVKAINKTKQNSTNAQRRREAEAKKREGLDDYRRGIVDANRGVNPYTKQKMETAEDVELYNTLKDMEEKGYDPSNVSDYHKFLKDKETERQNAEIEQQNAVEKSKEDIKAKANKEVADFLQERKDYDGEKLKLLFKDKDFSFFAEPLYDKLSLTEIVNRWDKINKEAELKYATKVIDDKAKANSSPGSLSETDTDVEPDISKMSSEQFRQYLKEIKSPFAF